VKTALPLSPRKRESHLEKERSHPEGRGSSVEKKPGAEIGVSSRLYDLFSGQEDLSVNENLRPKLLSDGGPRHEYDGEGKRGSFFCRELLDHSARHFKGRETIVPETLCVEDAVPHGTVLERPERENTEGLEDVAQRSPHYTRCRKRDQQGH